MISIEIGFGLIYKEQLNLQEESNFIEVKFFYFFR